MNELILLTDFWNEQNVENYLNCRDYFYKTKSFDPFEKYIERVLYDLEELNYEDVLVEFKETRQLSLFVLDKISFAYKMLENAEKSLKYFTRCTEVAQVILKTGDGTRNNPYKTIYGSDSKELMPYLYEKYKRHAIIDFDDKKLETVITESGNEYFFDVSELQITKENAVQERVDDMLKWFDSNTNRPV